MKYVVENFAATGCEVKPQPKEFTRVEDARREVKRRLGVQLLRAERRVVRPGAFEAYRGQMGCNPSGGVLIRRELAAERAERAAPPVKRGKKSSAAAANPSGDRAMVLQAVRHADTRERGTGRWVGAPLLSVRDLRAVVPLLPKERFDAAMTTLRREGLVVLHSHDYPAGLPESERALLVFDGKNYYNSASLRDAAGATREKQPSVGDLKARMLREFDRLQGAKGRGYVTLAELRRALPDVERAVFDETLQALRRDWVLTLAAAEGLHEEIPKDVREGGLLERNRNLVYVARREPE